MTKKSRSSGQASAWTNIEGNVHLVLAEPPKGHEVNHAPVIEQSHEYVIPLKRTGAWDES
jgi:hypothetical protein